MNNIKYMNLNEFVEKGYLQEVNRRFFHLLGLALEVKYDKYNNVLLNGIWDCRDDPEGICFGISNRSKESKKIMRDKSDFIYKEKEARAEARKKLFGSIIEPIND